MDRISGRGIKQTMLTDLYFPCLFRRMVWRTLTFVCVCILWIVVLRKDSASSRSCRRCHRQWRSFYLVSQHPCDRVNSLDLYNGMLGMGLACSAVVLAEILYESRKRWFDGFHAHGRRLDRLTSFSRMVLVFASSFAGWLYILQMRSSREQCITSEAQYLLFGTSWEIVSVRPCRHPRDLAVLARQIVSHNRVLLLLGINLAVIAVVIVEEIVLTMISLQGWRYFRDRLVVVPATQLPNLTTVTWSSSSSASLEQQQERQQQRLLQFQDNLSTPTFRSGDHIFVKKHDVGFSHAIVKLDSPTSPAQNNVVDSAMRRLDRILEDAMDESPIYRTSFASSSEASF